eukprot:12400778-Karenia_brevis.AAC.1
MNPTPSGQDFHLDQLNRRGLDWIKFGEKVLHRRRVNHELENRNSQWDYGIFVEWRCLTRMGRDMSDLSRGCQSRKDEEMTHWSGSSGHLNTMTRILGVLMRRCLRELLWKRQGGSLGMKRGRFILRLEINCPGSSIYRMKMQETIGLPSVVQGVMVGSRERLDSHTMRLVVKSLGG